MQLDSLRKYDLAFSEKDKNLVMRKNGDQLLYREDFPEVVRDKVGLKFPLQFSVTAPLSIGNYVYSVLMPLYTYYLYSYKEYWMLAQDTNGSRIFINISESETLGCVYDDAGICIQQKSKAEMTKFVQELRRSQAFRDRCKKP